MKIFFPLTLSVILILSFEGNAQKKWSVGIGAQTYVSTMHNIGQNENTAYNEFSQPSFTYLAPTLNQTTILSYGAHFILERSLGKSSSLDFGLGLSRTKNNLHFDYTPDKSSVSNIYNSVNMQRNYIYLPININLYTRLASNVRLKTSLGATSNFLFHLKDNYISQIEVGYDTFGQYNTVNFLGRAKVGLVYGKANQQTIECNLFTNFGINSITRKDGYTFLIYHNLAQSREIQYGIEVNYFFLH